LVLLSSEKRKDVRIIFRNIFTKKSKKCKPKQIKSVTIGEIEGGYVLDT
jgi:hypothetical protein